MITVRTNQHDAIAAVADIYSLSLSQVSRIARLWHCRHDTWQIADKVGIHQAIVDKVLSALRERRRG